MPAEAERSCSLYVLPAKPTEADLEIGYATRGAQLVACDAARRLAVETHEAEHALERTREAPRRPNFLQRLFGHARRAEIGLSDARTVP